MIHEFIGLPGAGKSYMAEKLARERGFKQGEISSRAEMYKLALIFALQHPGFFTRLLFVLIKENYKNTKLLKHKLMTLVLLVVAREFKAGKDGVMIETGFFQLLLSLYEREIKSGDINWCLNWLKKRSYVLYIIEATSEIRMKRIQERGRIPRGGVVTENKKRAEWFALLEHNFEIISEMIKENFKYELIQNN
jgi:shikimate kinase